MRKFLKWVFRIFLLLVVLVVAAVIFRNQLFKWFTEWELHDETGMIVSIGKMEVGIASPFIRIENLRLKNTRAFGGGTFMDIPEIYVEYDRDAIRAGKFSATLARLNLSEVNIVKNQAGLTNICVLEDHIEKVRKRKHRQLPDFNAIDTLQLTLGKARYLDLKPPANNFEFNFFLQNETVKNVKSESDLNGVILLAVVRNTAAMTGTGNGSMNSFLRDPQGTIEKTRSATKQFLDLLIPPKKAKKKN